MSHICTVCSGVPMSDSKQSHWEWQQAVGIAIGEFSEVTVVCRHTFSEFTASLQCSASDVVRSKTDSERSSTQLLLTELRAIGLHLISYSVLGVFCPLLESIAEFPLNLSAFHICINENAAQYVHLHVSHLLCNANERWTLV